MKKKVPSVKADKIMAYKKTDKGDLTLHIFYPIGFDLKKDKPRKSAVFFFGGGFMGGTVEQFYNQASYLASRGMVTICANYRTENSHGVSPQACIEDGKSAMRYVREQAEILGIDSKKIAAGGGSAGGNIAVGTAVITAFDCLEDNLNISPCPNLLILFNPVVDNGPDGYGYERVKDYYLFFSPYHNIKKDMPDSLFLLGDKDKLISVSSAEKFKKAVEKVGSHCELKIYPGGDHGFFNWKKQDEGEFFIDTLKEADNFLVKNNYLEPGEKVEEWVEKHLETDPEFPL